MKKTLVLALTLICATTCCESLRAAAQADHPTGQNAQPSGAPQPHGPYQIQAEWRGLVARDIAFTPGAIWMTRCDQRECGVTRIDASGKDVGTTVRTAHAPYGIAATETSVWATIPQENTLIRIDPSTNEIVARIATGKTPFGVAADEGSVWVTNADNKSVSRIDVKENKVTATIKVGVYPDRIAIGFGAVWVANAEASWGSVGTISRIDPATNSVVKTIKTWKYGATSMLSPSDILVSNGSLWVLVDEHVLRISPQSNKIEKWISVPNRKLFSMPEGYGRAKLHGLAAGNGWLWVGDSAQKELWKIDMGSGHVEHDPVHVGFPVCIVGQVEAKDGSLWITNPPEGRTLLVKP